MKRLLIALLFCGLLPATLPASTVQYVNSAGTYGPYNLLVDGQPTIGTCLTWDVTINGPWTAYWHDLDDFKPAEQTALLEAAWLNEQWATTTDWQELHEGIWNLFGADYTAGYSWVTLAQAHWQEIDPGSVRVLVPDPVRSSQTMLSRTPEPGTWFLILGGGMILLTRRRTG